jgi:hypothetical protein
MITLLSRASFVVLNHEGKTGKDNKREGMIEDVGEEAN